jgi:hypothetical protein
MTSEGHTLYIAVHTIFYKKNMQTGDIFVCNVLKNVVFAVFSHCDGRNFYRIYF